MYRHRRSDTPSPTQAPLLNKDTYSSESVGTDSRSSRRSATPPLSRPSRLPVSVSIAFSNQNNSSNNHASQAKGDGARLGEQNSPMKQTSPPRAVRPGSLPPQAPHRSSSPGGMQRALNGGRPPVEEDGDTSGSEAGAAAAKYAPHRQQQQQRLRVSLDDSNTSLTGPSNRGGARPNTARQIAFTSEGSSASRPDPDFENQPTRRELLKPTASPRQQQAQSQSSPAKSTAIVAAGSKMNDLLGRHRVVPRLTPSRLFIDREGSKELKGKVMKQASGFGFGLVKSMYHYCITGEFLKMFYINDQLTDVTISIGSAYFNVHRIVLVCHSEYFESVFLNKDETGGVVPSEIELSNISEDAFQSILEFMYSGDTKISLSNVVEILSASRHLKIAELERSCEEVLNNITPENALVILDIAQRYNLQAILEKSYRCITEYFYEVVVTESYLRLELNRVIALISDDNIQISSEMDTFRAAVRWIGYDRENRINNSERLMACIRFPLMSQEELIACVDEANDVMMKEGCIQLLYYANWYHTCIRLGRSGRYDMKGPQPRTKALPGAAAMGFGKDGDGESDWGRAFDGHGIGDDVDMSALTKPRASRPGAGGSVPPQPGQSSLQQVQKAANAINNGFQQPIINRAPSPAPLPRDKLNITSPTILIVGGFNMQKGDKKVPMRAVDIYLPKPNTWERLSKLPERRTHHAAAFNVETASLLITGGFNGRNVTDTVFKYDLSTNTWSTMAPMLTRRMCHQLCMLDNWLYAVGGQDDNQQLLSTVEKYNFQKNQWQYVAPMSCGKLGTSVAAHRGLLWVVGGYDDGTEPTLATAQTSGEKGGDKAPCMPVLKAVECYNPEQNAWTEMNALRFPRCMANLVEANGKLYLLGGATKCQASPQPTVVSIAAVDVYDDEGDEWYEASQLETPRYNAGCTVIGHRVFIAGGMNSMENQSLSSVECYDVKKDMWLKGVKDIPKVALGLSCVAVPPLKDIFGAANQ